MEKQVFDRIADRVSPVAHPALGGMVAGSSRGFGTSHPDWLIQEGRSPQRAAFCFLGTMVISTSFTQPI